jgi:hypothetical protein
MSTDYRTQKRIRMTDLVDGRLEEFGVRESIPSFTLPLNLNLKDSCYDSCTVDLMATTMYGSTEMKVAS